MYVVMLAIGLLLWAGGAMGFMASSTVMQQILAAIFGLSGTVLITGSAIVKSIGCLPQSKKD